MKSPAWQDVTLGELIELDAGFAFKSAQYTEADTDIKLLRGDNIGQGGLRWEGVKTWPKSDALNHTRYELRVDDVVLAMDRPWIEAGLKFAAVRQRDLPCLLVQRVARLRAKHGLHQRYLRYVIGSKAFTNHVKSITTGVNVPHISGHDISAFKLSLPPFDIQQRVSGILSAYDDLIEVNQRRIAILEDIARRLFDEWFVRFRYPGHEAVPLIETELGTMPEGWHPRKLSWWAAEIRATISPQRVDPLISYLGLEHLPRRSITLVEVGRAQDATSSKLRFEPGDILFGKIRPYFHKVAYMPFSGVCSTDAICIRATNPDHTALILGLVSSDAFVAHAVATSNGTKMPRADWKVLKNYPLPEPPKLLLSAFERAVNPMIESATNLAAQNVRLRSARDLLLPKLLSGEIDVSTAEETFAEAAE
ncbi:restriction endonuclease subunit S [Rhizobium leguminosarum]|uniref:restriction endonuclease subunit S n=1 Tax=Rhizobium leguminosarum TaxID=384 RepID=UPI001AE640AA|nr:restriction endonuclease subunit S [Rhizobium leguminosarum]MBP2442818.1 type I restriction enzyme S subunit [Rhizobium leguminosarum]